MKRRDPGDPSFAFSDTARDARAIAAGAATGAALSLCNVTSGLKLGWTASMGVNGAILAHLFFRLRSHRARLRAPFEARDAIVAATATTGAATIASTGLVAGIPAIEQLGGRPLGWAELAAWSAAVAILGATVASAVAGVLVADRGLAFPNAVAIRETAERGASEGVVGRARALFAGALVSGVGKLAIELRLLRSIAFPGAFRGVSLAKLGFAFEPSLLLVAIGGLIGFRACASLLAGSVVAWLGFAPSLLARGLVVPEPKASLFRALATWLVWPGAAAMIAGPLVSFALSLARGRGIGGAGPGQRLDVLPPRERRLAIAVASLAGAAVLRFVFGVPLVACVLFVALPFALGAVAARAQGETGVTPVGPMGRVAQLVAGIAAPGDVGASLMGAAMTGGASAEGTELATCLRAGQDLGVSPRTQWLAQAIGGVAGAAIGAAAYRLLVPSPSRDLFTAAWPAPAALQAKVVAEVLSKGISALPAGAASWAIAFAVLSIALAVVERRTSPAVRRVLPAAASFGLGFVVSPAQALALFAGGVVALVIARVAPAWWRTSWVAFAGGLVAGESFVGVAASVVSFLRG